MAITISVADAKKQIAIGEQWAALKSDGETVIQFSGSFGSAAKIASSMSTNKVGKFGIAVDAEDVESVEITNLAAQTDAGFWSYVE